MKLIIIFTFIFISLSSASTFYVGTTKGHGIFFSNLNTNTGELSSFNLGVSINRPSFLVIDKKKKILYSTNLNSWKEPGSLVSYKIQKDLTLKEISKTSSMGINPCHISLNPTKNILLSVNYNGPVSTSSYLISPSGFLSSSISNKEHFGKGVHPIRQKKPHAHSVFSHPLYPYVYVADLGSDAIFIYRLDQISGELFFIKKENISGESMGPRHMKWDKTGEFLYVVNELNPSLTIFKYYENGRIKEITNINALPKEINKNGLTAAEIRVHPSKPFIYISIRDKNNKGGNYISIFKMDGLSSYLIDTVKSEVEFPRNFNIDPSGKWMLIAGQKSKDIAVFLINKNGTISYKNKRYSFPGEPVCIEFLD